MYMNRYDVDDALRITRDYAPEWFPLALDLAALVRWTDDNSDGWPYWSKPSAASRSLQKALMETSYRTRRGETVPPPTDAVAKRLRAPVKAFLTRQGVDWTTVLGS